MSELRNEFSWNPWFLETYWPESEPRVRVVADVVARHVPDPAGRRLLEVGCANGFVAYLMRATGFDVTAVDAYDDPRRADMFARAGVEYVDSNLNDPRPLGGLPDAAFDVVLMGEVFEHLLNHPAGVLAAAHRVLRPGGLLVLTTPNPSTAANAWRVLRDRGETWGAREFLRDLKFDGGRVIDRGDIHYHEYPARMVREVMAEAGFAVRGLRYVRAGSAPSQGRPKRLAKLALRLTGLGRHRLFCPGYVLWGVRPGYGQVGLPPLYSVTTSSADSARSQTRNSLAHPISG